MFLISWTDKTNIFWGLYCERNGLDEETFKSGNIKPVERDSFTVGLILELWKKKRSVKEMLQWVTALTPLELQQYLSGMTTQNLNNSCNDLMKKAQKLGKNKKKEVYSPFLWRVWIFSGT